MSLSEACLKFSGSHLNHARRERWNLIGEGKERSHDENHARVGKKNCVKCVNVVHSLSLDIGVWLVIFLSLSRKDNPKPLRVRASWRNPDPYGRQAGTWRLDKAEVKGLRVKGQDRRPDVEAEESPVNHLRSFCLLINCLAPWEAGEQLFLSFRGKGLADWCSRLWIERIQLHVSSLRQCFSFSLILPFSFSSFVILHLVMLDF